MINIKELRIGNWLYIEYISDWTRIEYKSNEQVTEVMIDDGEGMEAIGFIPRKDIGKYTAESWIKYIKPISITEEILIQCGFQKIEDLSKYYIDPSFEIELYEGEFYCRLNGDLVPFINSLKSLHQLQNIYFDLTGNELNIDNI